MPVDFNFFVVARGNPLIDVALANNESARLLDQHHTELIGKERITKRAYLLSGPAATHGDRGEPSVGRPRPDQLFDRVSKDFSGHVVDVRFEHRELLRRSPVRDLSTQHDLSEQGKSVDLLGGGTVTDRINSHRRHRPEGP